MVSWIYYDRYSVTMAELGQNIQGCQIRFFLNSLYLTIRTLESCFKLSWIHMKFLRFNSRRCIFYLHHKSSL